MRNSIKSIGTGILGVLLFASCNNAEQQNQAASAPPAPYPTVKVQKRDVTSYKSYPTNIEGVVSSNVRAKVSGYITDVLVDEGQQVKKGQTLFRLETQTLNAEAQAQSANVQAAQVEVNKLIPLVEKNIISEVQLETARARLAQAKSAYQSVLSNINYANIQSPIDGTVGAINFRSGTLVSPNDQQPLTTVSQTDEVYAFFSMNERDYYDFLQQTEGSSIQEKISNFPKVKLSLAGEREYPYDGKIETVNAQVNTQTGTVNFRATFPNPEALLTHGNSGRVLIPNTYENATVIPSKSTYEQQGIVYTYRLKEDDIVENVMVKVEDVVGDLMIINQGVEENQTIVAEGVAKLKGGMKITPRPTSLDSIIGSTKPVFK